MRDTSGATGLQILCEGSYSAALTDLHMISQLTGWLTQLDTHTKTLSHTHSSAAGHTLCLFSHTHAHTGRDSKASGHVLWAEETVKDRVVTGV